MLIPSLLCVHGYTLSLIYLYYLPILDMATYSELVFYYMHAYRLPCLLIVSYVST